MTATMTNSQGTLSPLELAQAELYVTQTLDGVRGAIKGMTEAQWHFRPRENAWSCSLIVEHLIFVFEFVLGPRREQLLLMPPTELIGTQDTTRKVDSIVIHQFPSRLQKFPTPDVALPFGCLRCAPDALGKLPKLQQSALDYLQTPGLRERSMDAPPLRAVTGGEYTTLDGYQWLLAASAHAERHTKQVLEVKASPDYPLS